MKKWLKKVIGITKLEEENKKLSKNIHNLRIDLNDLYKLNEQVIKRNEFIISHFNISVDVNHPSYKEHSWAVISIQGKPEYVRFINLSNQDMHAIHRFLKQFDKTNMTIDSPYMFFK
ncbi:hypothetical protein [Bacillus mojavensis]